MNVKDIDISKIDVIENVRISMKDPALQELMESIKQMGLQQPIGVSPDNEGKYVLVFGHRRLTAYKKLGYKTIPAAIGEPLELKELLLQNVTENLQRVNNSPAELGQICMRLKDDYAMTEGEIAVRLSVPESKVRGAVDSYTHISPKLRSRIQFMPASVGRGKGNIAVSVVQKILTLRREYDLNTQQMEGLVEQARVNDLTGADMAVVAKLMKEGLSASRAMKERGKYRTIRVDIVVEINDIERRIEKSGLTAKRLLSKVCYGEEKPVAKPEFIVIESEKRSSIE